MLLQQALPHIDMAIYGARDALLHNTSKIIHGQARGVEDSARTCHELSQSRYESHMGWATTCTIGSSRYKNLKLRKEEEEEEEP
jgi:hypothetical protein